MVRRLNLPHSLLLRAAQRRMIRPLPVGVSPAAFHAAVSGESPRSPVDDLAISAVRKPVEGCLAKAGGSARISVAFQINGQGASGATLQDATVISSSSIVDAEVKSCVVEAVNAARIAGVPVNGLRPVKASFEAPAG